MNLPEPAWRVKTRPCPFYQQGRCYFSDSCNFLHDVSLKAKPDSGLLDPLPQASDTHEQPAPTPVVTVESPHSNRSPTEPASASQSLRFASLISALGENVGQHQLHSTGNHESEDRVGGGSPSETIEAETGSAAVNRVGSGEEPRSSSRSSQDGWTMISPVDDTTETEPPPTSPPWTQRGFQSSLMLGSTKCQDSGFAQSASSPEVSHLLSPVDSSLELAQFPSLRLQDNEEKRENTIDSGYADVCVPSRASILSPPRSPTRTSTFDLLSSPFGPLTNRVLSPRLSAFVPHSPVSPIYSSFPSTRQDTSQLDPDTPDLDSPSNYHSASRGFAKHRLSGDNRLNDLNSSYDGESLREPPSSISNGPLSPSPKQSQTAELVRSESGVPDSTSTSPIQASAPGTTLPAGPSSSPAQHALSSLPSQPDPLSLNASPGSPNPLPLPHQSVAEEQMVSLHDSESGARQGRSSTSPETADPVPSVGDASPPSPPAGSVIAASPPPQDAVTSSRHSHGKTPSTLMDAFRSSLQSLHPGNPPAEDFPLTAGLADLRKSFAIALELSSPDDSRKESDDNPNTRAENSRPLYADKENSTAVHDKKGGASDDRQPIQHPDLAPYGFVATESDFGSSYFSGVAEDDPFAAAPGDSWLAPPLEFDQYDTEESHESTSRIPELPADQPSVAAAHIEPQMTDEIPSASRQASPPSHDRFSNHSSRHSLSAILELLSSPNSAAQSPDNRDLPVAEDSQSNPSSPQVLFVQPEESDSEDAVVNSLWADSATPRAEWFSDGPARAVIAENKTAEVTPERNEDENQSLGDVHEGEPIRSLVAIAGTNDDARFSVGTDYSALLEAANGSPRQTLVFLSRDASPDSVGYAASYLESVEESLDDDEDDSRVVHYPSEAVSMGPSPASQSAYLDSPTSSSSSVGDATYGNYGEYEGSANGNDSLADDTSRSSTDYNGQSLLAAVASSSSLTSLSMSSISPIANVMRERGYTSPTNAFGRRDSRRRSILNMTPSALNSPSSLRSPSLSSIGSVSRGRQSPQFSDSQDRQVSSNGDSQEIQVSTKVPFGFRRSFSLGRASKSSLLSNRMSKAGHQPSPPSSAPAATEPPTSPTSDSVLSAIVSPTNSTGRPLRPLRLSALISSVPSSSPSPRHSTRSQSPGVRSSMLSTSSVSSSHSLPSNPLLSSSRLALIPEKNAHTNDTLSPLSTTSQFPQLFSFDEPRSAPVTRKSSWNTSSPLQQEVTGSQRPYSGISGPDLPNGVVHEQSIILPNSVPSKQTNSPHHDAHDPTITTPSAVTPRNALRRSRSSIHRSVAPVLPLTRTSSVARLGESAHAIATPRPTLMFAIASDDVEQVKKVLESGEAGPNDAVGPQSALEFALTNDKLTKKMDIVKTLLAYGADPSVMKKLEQQQKRISNAGSGVGRRLSTASSHNSVPGPSASQAASALNAIDPATKYYVSRADAAHTRRTSALIYRSFFRPLTKVRYELIGQDRALEQLFRVLSIHSRQLSATPIVVLLCGPSGHGKSLLARKFGTLLDVPTHTVNMTTLRSTLDLWKSYSMSPYETPTSCTLAEFLINNEGKRCVVVLDEIEKTEDEKYLWSLLMPWELGRCAFEARSRHVDVRNVIWLGTSNLGYDTVLQHHEARANTDEMMLREEYVALMESLRPKVSERLGASILSRVTTVLPFVPFTTEEKRAICSEALYNLAGETLRELTPETVESITNQALAEYIVNEGARSLYRAVSNQLIDLV